MAASSAAGPAASTDLGRRRNSGVDSTGIYYLASFPGAGACDPDLAGSPKGDVRASGVQLLAGLFVAAGLYFTGRTYRLSFEGHITERFTRAVDQLGHADPGVRIGGIHALLRIAADSSRDRLSVVDVLAAYVRHHSPSKQRPQPSAPPENEPVKDSLERIRAYPRIAVDVQSALRGLVAVSQRLDPAKMERESFILDLSDSDLRSTDMRGARFPGVVLNRAFLDNSQLEGADLQGAQLFGTSFCNACLWDTNLDFTDSNFGARTEEDGVDFTGALYSDKTTWPRRDTGLSPEMAARLKHRYPSRYEPREAIYCERLENGKWAPRPRPDREMPH